MDISRRIQLSRMLLQMEEEQKFCERLGLKDTSYYKKKNKKKKENIIKKSV